MNLNFKYRLIYLGIPFFAGLFFINLINFNKENIGGPTTTLSHTNDIMESTACSIHSTNTNSVGVQSDGYWDAFVTTESPWLHLLDPTSGQGDGFVRYQVDPNYTGSPRTGILNIGGQDFTVVQNPYDETGTCTAEPNLSELRATSSGVSTEVQINDWGMNLDWQIKINNVDWVIPDRTGGRGSGSAVLMVVENPQPGSRMTVVIIGQKKIPVIQEGLPRDR